LPPQRQSMLGIVSFACWFKEQTFFKYFFALAWGKKI